jgi:aspartate-semialdehyde dehydrogenase
MSMSKKHVIAVVGATGAVGEAMFSILEERMGKDIEVHALASKRSFGKTVDFGRQEIGVDILDTFDFSKVDYALFSAGAKISRKFVPKAIEQGCIVIDNTSEFRYVDDIPLVVPEVNAQELASVGPGSIIANPNCSTIQLVVALAPIYRAAGIDRINVATYQSVSGAGRAGMEELAKQTLAKLTFKESEPEAFRQQIAFNVLPEIDSFENNGYTREEMKLQWETSKIFGDSKVLVNATAVRVPVFYGHSEAVHLETSRDITIEEISALLKDAPGVTHVEDRKSGLATAVTHGAGNDDVFVSRLRRDHTHPRGVNLWVVSDNVRKGAALNAIQIMEAIEAQGSETKGLEN